MAKPFIKLFKTPNTCCCLDVNKNEFIQIEQCSFEYTLSLFYIVRVATSINSEGNGFYSYFLE